MRDKESVTFQEALDAVESLPEPQQEELVHVIQRRHQERQRELLAKRIKEARAEYDRGEVTQGSVEDLLKELAG